MPDPAPNSGIFDNDINLNVLKLYTSISKDHDKFGAATKSVCLKVHSHQIKIVTDWLQTGIWLASDSKICVNGTMLYQCNPTAFYQSEARLLQILVWMSHKGKFAWI